MLKVAVMAINKKVSPQILLFISSARHGTRAVGYKPCDRYRRSLQQSVGFIPEITNTRLSITFYTKSNRQHQENKGFCHIPPKQLYNTITIGIVTEHKNKYFLEIANMFPK
jgi:hypothetical protein